LPVAQHGECGPWSQNTDAIGNELPFPARHGQNERLIALGRKSWLFAGSDRGAERAAVMATLIMTAKLNDVDPQAWLADVLVRINDHAVHKLDELLPWNWRKPMPSHAKAA
jgi:transposase